MPTVYEFIEPAIPSVGVYYFTTDQGVDYEVRFGRKQTDILFVNIVFGVRNEEYEGEEYVLTNKGEFYSVMSTLEAIIHHFLERNPNIHGFEFAGEPAYENEDAQHITKRTRVYTHQARKIFPAKEWKITTEGNKVTIERKR